MQPTVACPGQSTRLVSDASKQYCGYSNNKTSYDSETVRPESVITQAGLMHKRELTWSIQINDKMSSGYIVSECNETLALLPELKQVCEIKRHRQLTWYDQVNYWCGGTWNTRIQFGRRHRMQNGFFVIDTVYSRPGRILWQVSLKALPFRSSGALHKRPLDQTPSIGITFYWLISDVDVLVY